MDQTKKCSAKWIALSVGFLVVLLGVGGFLIAGRNRTACRNASYLGKDALGHLWMLKVEENGDFWLYDLYSSMLSIKDTSEYYEWKEDRLTLNYANGTVLCFEEDGENLVFSREKSNYTDSGEVKASGVPGISDGMIFALMKGSEE